jgi:hypothetical protein
MLKWWLRAVRSVRTQAPTHGLHDVSHREWFKMRAFPCPYLGGEVELTDEREAHIAYTHPDLLPEYLDQIRQTLADPDQVRRSTRMSTARLLDRWFEDIRQGKYVVVVVVSEVVPKERHWIITAYMTSRLAKGEVEWRKN